MSSSTSLLPRALPRKEDPWKEPGNFGDPLGLNMYDRDMRNKDLRIARHPRDSEPRVHMPTRETRTPFTRETARGGWEDRNSDTSGLGEL